MQQRAIWAVAIFGTAMAACGGEMQGDAGTACTPGEARLCSCSNGMTGAQVCEGDGSRLGPCVCAVDDGGLEEPDAGAAPMDAGGELDGGPADAGAPVEPDAGPTVPADAGPLWGECWLSPHGGCAEGEGCRLSTDHADRPPRCEPAGHRREGAECYTGRECAAGLMCFGLRCRAYCRLGDGRECVSGTECTGVPGWEPYGLCLVPR